jgi:hypothetical protein
MELEHAPATTTTMLCDATTLQKTCLDIWLELGQPALGGAVDKWMQCSAVLGVSGKVRTEVIASKLDILLGRADSEEEQKYRDQRSDGYLDNDLSRGQRCLYIGTGNKGVCSVSCK